MDVKRNLAGILFCLVCGLSCGVVGWPSLNMDLLNEDMRKEVDLALQVVNQPSFQGWRMELIKQAVPRVHIGLVELWLQLRKLQKDQDEMWRKMKRSMRMSAASCQELNDQIKDFAIQVPKRIEKRVEIINVRVKNMEDAHKAESVYRTHRMEEHLEESTNSSELLPKRACHPQACANSAKGPKKGKVSTTLLTHKVAALTELLNGHNELLVELYQRMTALEEAEHAPLTPQDGSGDGQ